MEVSRNQTRPPIIRLGGSGNKDLRAKDGARTQRVSDESRVDILDVAIPKHRISRVVELRGPVMLAEFIEQRLVELLVEGRL